MINIENKVFNDIAQMLRTKYSGISVIGEYVESPSTFPCVTIVEDDNSTYLNSRDDSNVEHHANVMYSVNVYSNLVKGKKSQAKEIANDIDNAMMGMKFTRNMMSQVPNIDRTIYRITARYTAVVEEGKDIDGNEVHRIYRK